MFNPLEMHCYTSSLSRQGAMPVGPFADPYRPRLEGYRVGNQPTTSPNNSIGGRNVRAASHNRSTIHKDAHAYFFFLKKKSGLQWKLLCKYSTAYQPLAVISNAIWTTRSRLQHHDERNNYSQ